MLSKSVKSVKIHSPKNTGTWEQGLLDPPLYASKYNSNNNGTFSGFFTFLKRNAKTEIFKTGGGALPWSLKGVFEKNENGPKTPLSPHFC